MGISSSEPPFEETYKTLLQNSPKPKPCDVDNHDHVQHQIYQLPLVDVSHLGSEQVHERNKCVCEIAEAAREWGFFQVINHGVPKEILDGLRQEQVNLFRQPFEKKVKVNFLMNITNNYGDNYRWGSPYATSLSQFNWSEAFQLPVNDITKIQDDKSHFRSFIKSYTETVACLAGTIAKTLAENLGVKDTTYFQENCTPNTCLLRLNRYPPCPFSTEVFGIVPHTDSGFLTILFQDQVGGLQLKKDDKWICVSPNPDALIVNIGDLLQAWSNDVYKSVKHRVLANAEVERFSVAYFYYPSSNTMIQNCLNNEPSIYRKFSLKEYKTQIFKDVQATGDKVGLSRFLSLNKY